LNVLVIDTASSMEIIAACAGDTAAEASALVHSSHSATILSTIDRCMKKLGLTPGDLDVIGVGTGPGSFTGIRIAVSTARMFAQVLGRPLVGMPTHLLYAVSMEAAEDDNILIAFDAKKGRVFGALYRKTGGLPAPREIIAPGDYAIERLIEGVDESRMTHCAGNGVEKYEQAVSTLSLLSINRDVTPDGKAICALVLEAFRKNPDGYADYNNIVPCYARKSDAETAKEMREKM
jgi:tRNA threonylcarbamoyladenosine biosynthesis protein TsaB